MAALTGENDFGVYAVTATHVVFGPGALVYIGKAQEQSFARRIAQHHPWLASESDVLIRVGRIVKGDYPEQEDWRDWNSLLKMVEELTIYWHSPPYNSKSITRYTGDPLRVQNWGDRGRLLPEYSSHWRLSRPDDSAEDEP